MARRLLLYGPICIYKTFILILDTTGLQEAKNVEYCRCEDKYTGPSCNLCNTGYKEAPATSTTTTTTTTTCVPCSCNGHSKSCLPDTGVCLNCLHNTAGDRCQVCTLGYYGDPTTGSRDACKECACPGGLHAPNQFAIECEEKGGEGGIPYRCLRCQPGYEGARCDVCSEGFQGDPLDPLGGCVIVPRNETH